MSDRRHACMLNALYEARGYLLAVRTDVGAARELAARIGHAIEEAEAPAPRWQYDAERVGPIVREVPA